MFSPINCLVVRYDDRETRSHFATISIGCDSLKLVNLLNICMLTSISAANEEQVFGSADENAPIVRVHARVDEHERPEDVADLHLRQLVVVLLSL